VVKQLKSEYGWIFEEPVDPLKLGLPDYFDVIKYPMDLGTVRRLVSRRFPSPSRPAPHPPPKYDQCCCSHHVLYFPSIFFPLLSVPFLIFPPFSKNGHCPLLVKLPFCFPSPC
jgi:hypothetical protein